MLEKLLGAALILLALADVFSTVLYARMSSGLLSRATARGVWILFNAIAAPFTRARARIASFAAPAIMVSLIGSWVLLLAVGLGLVFHSELGSGIRRVQGDTPTDFISALYIGANVLTSVGVSDFAPRTSAMRLVWAFGAVAGISIITLTITYLMQIYTALQRRNALTLEIDLLTRRTGDAAEMLAGIGPRGDFETATSTIEELARAMTVVKEAHHLYPTLFYFRFEDSHYSLTRALIVVLDCVALIETALDASSCATLRESSAVAELDCASRMLVTSLVETFLPHGREHDPDDDARARWRRRYFAALRRLRQARVPTTHDEQTGADRYVERRHHWERYVRALEPAVVWPWREIDPIAAPA